MRKWFWLLACVTANAEAQSVVIGKRLIGRGDGVERVREAAGEPDRLDRIGAEAGAPPMQIWTYERRGRKVTVWIVDDRVVRVDEAPAEGA